MHFNTKIIGWVIIIVVVGGALYAMFTKAPVQIIDQSGNPNATQAVGSDLLQLLSKLKTVNFNTELFNNPDFRGLIDWAIVLPAPALGRPNPFERIGIDVGVVKTVAPGGAQ
ncbi:MAG TPA: hypothetical protein VJJ27_01985 [Candidatus Paceibacterota bacterium]